MRLLIAVLGISIAVPAGALEKQARPDSGIDRDGAAQWSMGCTSTIRYFNLCTGWIWTWSGWQPEDRASVYFQTESCVDLHVLEESWHFAQTGAPAGYGYTGTMKLQAVDSIRCPSVTLATRPFLPAPGWNRVVWQEFPPSGSLGYLVTWTNGPVPGSPVVWLTDHPSAGPTGPPACGTCYPVQRGTRSYRFGPAASPFCPGIVFEDDGCNAELVWEITGLFTKWVGPPVSVDPHLEASSWGAIKNLYRSER
jgi:hypothetical protein